MPLNVLCIPNIFIIRVQMTYDLDAYPPALHVKHRPIYKLDTVVTEGRREESYQGGWLGRSVIEMLRI